MGSAVFMIEKFYKENESPGWDQGYSSRHLKIGHTAKFFSPSHPHFCE
jgi:hypothetical protein